MSNSINILYMLFSRWQMVTGHADITCCVANLTGMQIEAVVACRVMTELIKSGKSEDTVVGRVDWQESC